MCVVCVVSNGKIDRINIGSLGKLDWRRMRETARFTDQIAVVGRCNRHGSSDASQVDLGRLRIRLKRFGDLPLALVPAMEDDAVAERDRFALLDAV